jgi:3-deoxy-D-manno-octulosonate 8-phosphate phosphatase (KDO 8-P phosphatase)
MQFLEQNIKGLCTKFGVDFNQLLNDFEVDSVGELAMIDLEAFAEENEVDLYALLYKPLFLLDHLKPRLAKVKLLIMDVDGVLSDGGMYYTESGDQFKKYNAKDGMAIMHAQEKGLNIGIISSAFKPQMVLNRAETLSIKYVYAGRDPKMMILNKWCQELGIGLDEVAMIGDDINDLPIMEAVGFRCCPADAVQVVKNAVDVVLNKKGGHGCVRELIDNYLLERPIGSSEKNQNESN